MERNTYLNVTSPGFTSRIMDRASESYHVKRRKVPVLGFSRLPLLNPSRNIKSSSFIRIAPPEPRPIDINEVHSTEGNENKDPKRKSILQTLNDASKKRSYDQDQNGCDNFIRKKRKEDYKKIQNKRSHEVSWMDEERTSDGERKRSKRSDNRNRSSEIRTADIVVESRKNDTIEEKTASLDINKEDRSVARMLSFTSSMNIIAPHITRDVSFDRAMEDIRVSGPCAQKILSNTKNEISVIVDVEPIPRDSDVSENMDTTSTVNDETKNDDSDTLPTGRVFNRLGMRIPRLKDKNEDTDTMINPLASKITETNQNNGNYEGTLLDDAYGSLTRGDRIDRSRLRRVMNKIKEPPKDDATMLRSILSSPNVKKSPFSKQVTFSVPVIEGNGTIVSKTDSISLEPGPSTLSFTSVNSIDTPEREFETSKDGKGASPADENTVNGENGLQLPQKEAGNSEKLGSSGNLVGGFGSNLVKSQDHVDAPSPSLKPQPSEASKEEPKTLATSTQPSSNSSNQTQSPFPNLATVPSAASPAQPSLAFGSTFPQSNLFGSSKLTDNAVKPSTAFGTTTAATANSTAPLSTPLFKPTTQTSVAFGEVKEPPAFDSVVTSSSSFSASKSAFGIAQTSTSNGLFGTTQSLTNQPSTAQCTGSVFGAVTQSAASSTAATTTPGITATGTPAFKFNSTSNANATSFETKGFTFGSNQNIKSIPQTNTTEKPNTPFGNPQLTPSFGSPQSTGFGSGKSMATFGSVPLTSVGFGNTQSTTAPVFSTAQSTSTTTFGTIQAPPAFGTTQTTSATVFGTTQAPPAFGTTQTTSATAFGTIQTPPAFGTTQTTSAPAFGAIQASPAFGTTQTTSAPAFGAIQAPPAFGTTQTTSAPAFGTKQPTSAPTFGTTQTASAPAFGATQNSTTPFGSAQPGLMPAFGTIQPTTTSAFNTTQSSFTPTFKTPESSIKSAFGVTSANSAPRFGSSTLFGATKEAVPTTTSSQITNPTPAGGFVFRSTSQPAFGTTNNAPPTFGSPANPPAFGSSTFGNSTNPPSMFSAAVKPEATFGNPTGVSSVFGASGNQPTFGASGNQSTFGASGNQSTFGASGNLPTFGASGSQPSFGAPSNPPPAFNVGQPPAFGATAQPAANSVFNFGSSQSTNPSMFTFGQGTSTNTQPGPQPFTFNAGAPVAQPPAGGGMFSIGSATSSRARNTRRTRR